MNQPAPPTGESAVEFDIHGLVGIRLIDPPPKAVAVMTSHLGHFRSTLDRPADITVRFVEEIRPQRIKYLGLNQTAFDEKGFYILNPRTGTINARIPFERIGSQCEILCRRQRSRVPYLFDIIRLTLLNRNYIPVHASAFLYRGIGVLVSGWARGGKTTGLLSFANHGAYYIGDDWVVVSGDGREMFGLPGPVSIWDWQFNQIPGLLPPIPFRQRCLFKGIHALETFHKTLARGILTKVLALNLLGESLPIIRRKLRVKALPQELFGERYYKEKASLDKVFITISHREPAIGVDPFDGAAVSQQILHSNVQDQLHMVDTYQAFRFAFPDRRNPLIEESESRQSALLQRAFAGKEAYRVLHPYPVSFEALFDQLKPYCEKRGNVSVSSRVERNMACA